jgi:hypothetical protein
MKPSAPVTHTRTGISQISNFTLIFLEDYLDAQRAVAESGVLEQEEAIAKLLKFLSKLGEFKFFGMGEISKDTPSEPGRWEVPTKSSHPTGHSPFPDRTV